MKTDYPMEASKCEAYVKTSALVQALSHLFALVEERQALLKEELDIIEPAYITSDFKRRFKERLTDLDTVAAGLFVMHKMVSDRVAEMDYTLFCGCRAEGSIN